MRCDQNVLGPICLGKTHGIKILVSQSFGLIEGHWEYEKHVVMLGCLCQALLRVDGATL